MSDSDHPEKRSTTFLEIVKVDRHGRLFFTPRSALFLLMLLGITGGGGSLLANWGLASADSVEKLAVKQQQSEVRLDAHEGQLEMITVKIGSIQDVQHWQAADQAAERVAQEAPENRHRETYKRLFKWNMARLKSKPPRLPCANLDCTN